MDARKPIALSVLLIASLTYAQLGVNLVPNPSFEEHSGCPGLGQTSRSVSTADHWQDAFNPPLYWSYTDYFHPCGVTGNSAPQSTYGFQHARTDSAYAGFYAFHTFPNVDEIRGYVQTILDVPLEAGKTYYVEFFVSRADWQPLGIFQIGAYLSVNRPYSAAGNYNNRIQAIPQVKNPDFYYLTDSVGWTRISGYFVADGGEQYLTIGNFSPDSLTPYTGSYYMRSTYFIDDVMVIESEETTSVNDLIGESEINVYPNPSSGIVNFEIIAPGISGDATIVVMDLSGKTVMALSVELTPPETNVQIDIDRLSTGIYLYRIESENAILEQGKLIIQ